MKKPKLAWTPARRRTVRYKNYFRLYGEGWEERFRDQLGEDWERILEEQWEAGVDTRRPIPVPPNPDHIRKLATERRMSRRELCGLIAARLRNPGIKTAAFTVLARLYRELRGWGAEETDARSSAKKNPDHLLAELEEEQRGN